MQTNFRNTVQYTKGHCNTNKPKRLLYSKHTKEGCNANKPKRLLCSKHTKEGCNANKPKSYCKTNKHEDL